MTPASLHVDTSRSWRGGQQQLLNLLTGLAARRLPVKLLCEPESPLAEASHAAGIPWEPLVTRGPGLLTAPWVVRRAQEAMRATILHAHDARAHGICQASRMGRSGRNLAPLVVHRRVDFPIGRSFGGHLKYHRRDVQYCAVSQAVAEVLIHGGVRPEQIDVVPSAVAPLAPQRSRAAVRAALGVGDGRLLVGAVGHLARHKGHRVLVEAAARLPASSPVEIVIAGAGEEGDALQAQITRLGVGARVRLLGFRGDVPDLLGALDLLAHPSLEEGLGTVLLDALGMGVPVMASKAGGIPEALGDGRFGALLPPGGVGAWARALDALPERLPELRRRAQEGRAWVGRRTVGDMVDGVLGVYQRVVERAPPLGRGVGREAVGVVG